MKIAALSAASLLALALPAAAELLPPQAKGPIKPYREIQEKVNCPGGPTLCIIKFLKVPAKTQLRVERVQCVAAANMTINEPSNNLKNVVAFVSEGGVAEAGPFFFAAGETVVMSSFTTGTFWCSLAGFVVPVD